jgi:hypothetical protein
MVSILSGGNFNLLSYSITIGSLRQKAAARAASWRHVRLLLNVPLLFEHLKPLVQYAPKEK